SICKSPAALLPAHAHRPTGFTISCGWGCRGYLRAEVIGLEPLIDGEGRLVGGTLLGPISACQRPAGIIMRVVVSNPESLEVANVGGVQRVGSATVAFEIIRWAIEQVLSAAAAGAVEGNEHVCVSAGAPHIPCPDRDHVIGR